MLALLIQLAQSNDWYLDECDCTMKYTFNNVSEISCTCNRSSASIICGGIGLGFFVIAVTTIAFVIVMKLLEKCKGCCRTVHVHTTQPLVMNREANPTYTSTQKDSLV